jgi:hypothetical protein
LRAFYSGLLSTGSEIRIALCLIVKQLKFLLTGNSAGMPYLLYFSMQDEAEKRLMQAKRGGLPQQKRRLDDINLSDDSPPPEASKEKGRFGAKQQLTLDDSDDDF